jgi:hypothetical protein
MKSILLAFGLFLIGTGCAPTLSPFTEKLYTNQNWTKEDLSKIQFYVDEPILLYRRVSDASTEIIQGKVRIEQGQKIEEVIIPRGTPGVYLFSPKGEHLAIGFDPEHTDRYLIFGPNPKARGAYTLLGKDWGRQEGTVTYGGTAYQTRAQAGLTALMIDVRKAGSTQVSRSTVRGRRL